MGTRGRILLIWSSIGLGKAIKIPNALYSPGLLSLRVLVSTAHPLIADLSSGQNVPMYPFPPSLYLLHFTILCTPGHTRLYRVELPRLEELGGSTILCGLARLVMCLAEVPFFYISGQLIRLIGVRGAIILAQTAYFVRFLYYSVCCARHVVGQSM